ncbi:MAG: isochorismatase family protein, partial [Vibrionaceae bacterium]|nr:isochorismatase family protein [Vibrionaceae bacterium]
MSKTALLLIDIQNDYFSSFSGAKWALSGTESAAQNAAMLLSVFREKNLPVIHVRHQFTTADAPFFAPDTEGAQIHASVTPQSGETVVVKSEINSFKAT